MKTCLLVLGMHRSGTSAITGALEKIGVTLPQDLMRPHSDNPKGYFESEEVMRINDNLLGDLNSNWDDTRFSVFMNQSMIDKHSECVKSFIEKEFAYSKIFMLKDPRMCITFPLWERALKDLGINIKVVFPYRNPFEVSRSLKSRNDFSMEKSILLWVKHVLYAEKYSRPYPRYFLDFNSLLTHTAEEMEKVARFVGIKAETLAIEEISDRFLERDLKHHNLDVRNVAENLPFFIKKLLVLVQDGSFSEATIEEFDAIFNEVNSAYQFLNNYDVLLQSNNSRDLRAQRDDARAQSQGLAQQLHTLTDEKAQLEEARAEQLKQLQALEDEKAALTQTHQQLNHEHDELVADLEVVKEAKQSQKADDGARIHGLEQQLHTLTDEKAQLEEARAEQLKQHQALDAENTELEESQARLNQEVANLTQAIDYVVRDLARLKESKSWTYTKSIRDLTRILKSKKNVD